MPIKIHIIIILLLASVPLFSQNKWLATTGGNFGFHNGSSTLWNYEVKSSTSAGVFFQLGYSHPITEKLSLAIEPGIQQYYNIVLINELQVKIYSYSMELPIHIAYSINNKLETFLGYSFQNYREVDDMELLKSNNIRNNIFVGARYQFSRHWAGFFRYSRMISKQVDYLTARQFENQFFLGITFLISRNKKEETK